MPVSVFARARTAVTSASVRFIRVRLVLPRTQMVALTVGGVIAATTVVVVAR